MSSVTAKWSYSGRWAYAVMLLILLVDRIVFIPQCLLRFNTSCLHTIYTAYLAMLSHFRSTDCAIHYSDDFILKAQNSNLAVSPTPHYCFLLRKQPTNEYHYSHQVWFLTHQSIRTLLKLSNKAHDLHQPFSVSIL